MPVSCGPFLGQSSTWQPPLMLAPAAAPAAAAAARAAAAKASPSNGLASAVAAAARLSATMVARASFLMRVSSRFGRCGSAQVDSFAGRQRHGVDDPLLGLDGRQREAGALRTVAGAWAILAARRNARGRSSAGRRSGEGITEQRPGVGGRASAGPQQDGGGKGEGELAHGCLLGFRRGFVVPAAATHHHLRKSAGPNPFPDSFLFSVFCSNFPPSTTSTSAAVNSRFPVLGSMILLPCSRWVLQVRTRVSVGPARPSVQPPYDLV